MLIDKKFKLELLDGHNVIVNGENGNVLGNADFNEIKMFLWQITQEREITKSQMLDETLKKFEISTVLALGEIDYFIKKMKEYGII